MPLIKDNGMGGYYYAAKVAPTINGVTDTGWIQVADDDSRLALVNHNDGSQMTYVEKRTRNLADGGYGTWREQLDMIHTSGIDAWNTHCETVKTNFPK